MNGTSTGSDDAMAALRCKYRARLQQREQDIEALLVRGQGSGWSAAERNELHRHAHSLAGSGATYGYPDISSIGAALEAGLDASAPPTVLLPLARKLCAACHRASQAGPVAEPQLLVEAPCPLTEFDLPRSRKIILVIDDDPSVQELIAAYLKDDAEIILTSNGADGLAAAYRRKPDLILLDIAMPGMHGISLLETLQSDEALRQTPVIMLSAHRTDTHVAQAAKRGALGYIAKPFQPAAMVAKIRAFLARQAMTVLVADNDISVRDILQEKLRAAGITVLLAIDGAAALSVARTHRPSLAVVDWMMPGLDGPTLVHTLKQAPGTRAIKVIMLTARRQRQDILKGFHLGAEDYITKPFDVDDVVTRCLRLLGLKK